MEFSLQKPSIVQVEKEPHKLCEDALTSSQKLEKQEIASQTKAVSDQSIKVQQIFSNLSEISYPQRIKYGEKLGRHAQESILEDEDEGPCTLQDNVNQTEIIGTKKDKNFVLDRKQMQSALRETSSITTRLEKEQNHEIESPLYPKPIFPSTESKNSFSKCNKNLQDQRKPSKQHGLKKINNAFEICLQYTEEEEKYFQIKSELHQIRQKHKETFLLYQIEKVKVPALFMVYKCYLNDQKKDFTLVSQQIKTLQKADTVSYSIYHKQMWLQFSMGVNMNRIFNESRIEQQKSPVKIYLRTEDSNQTKRLSLTCLIRDCKQGRDFSSKLNERLMNTKRSFDYFKLVEAASPIQQYLKYHYLEKNKDLLIKTLTEKNVAPAISYDSADLSIKITLNLKEKQIVLPSLYSLYKSIWVSYELINSSIYLFDPRQQLMASLEESFHIIIVPDLIKKGFKPQGSLKEAIEQNILTIDEATSSQGIFNYRVNLVGKKEDVDACLLQLKPELNKGIDRDATISEIEIASTLSTSLKEHQKPTFDKNLGKSDQILERQNDLACNDEIKMLKDEGCMNYPLAWERIHELQQSPLGFLKIGIDKQSREFAHIKKLIYQTLGARTVIKVQKIQNRFLWRQYYEKSFQLRAKDSRAEPSEKFLFYGSYNINPKEIYAGQEGFSMNHVRKGKWGEGLYFSTKSSFTHTYRHKKTNGTNKIFLAKVLVGDFIDMVPDINLTSPPVDKRHGLQYDSVKGETADSEIFILYSSAQAYPEYLITYS